MAEAATASHGGISPAGFIVVLDVSVAVDLGNFQHSIHFALDHLGLQTVNQPLGLDCRTGQGVESTDAYLGSAQVRLGVDPGYASGCTSFYQILLTELSLYCAINL